MSLAENEKRWVVLCGDEIFGLVTAYEIKRAMHEGTIWADDCVWKKGWTQWKLLKDVPIFSYECAKSAERGRGIPDVPVPGTEDFKNILTPQVSPEDLRTSKRLGGIRAAFIVGSSILWGTPGAAFASCIAKREKIDTSVLHDPEVLAMITGKLSDA